MSSLDFDQLHSQIDATVHTNGPSGKTTAAGLNALLHRMVTDLPSGTSLTPDQIAALEAINPVTLTFNFNTGFADDITTTIEPARAGTYTMLESSNVADVRLVVNNNAAILPVKLAAGDTLQLLISRSSPSSNAYYSLLKTIGEHVDLYSNELAPSDGELLLDPGFDSQTVWTMDSNWSIANSQAIDDGTGGGSGRIWQAVDLVAGQAYDITIDASATGGGGIGFLFIHSQDGSGLAYHKLNSGVTAFQFYATTAEQVMFSLQDNFGNGAINSVSMKIAPL
jgi:hypothetical protein